MRESAFSKSNSIEFWVIFLSIVVALIIIGSIVWMISKRKKVNTTSEVNIESEKSTVEKKMDNTKIIGIISGGLFLLSFFFLGLVSFSAFSLTTSISGGQIIQSAFDNGKPEAIFFGLILVSSVICATTSAWFYYNSNVNLAKKLGLGCLSCIFIVIIFSAIKLESLSIIKYMGAGAWLSLLSAVCLTLAPRINALTSKSQER